MLSQLSLKSCSLAGEIPKWMSTQKDLDCLDLSENQLDGKLQIGLLKWKLKYRSVWEQAKWLHPFLSFPIHEFIIPFPLETQFL